MIYETARDVLQLLTDALAIVNRETTGKYDQFIATKIDEGRSLVRTVVNVETTRDNRKVEDGKAIYMRLVRQSRHFRIPAS